jgi:putative RNA 2'-phosphotransferase
MLSDSQRERLSKLMAYLLRHDPDLERTREGFTEITKLVEAMKQKIQWVGESHLKEVVEMDPKGRYEICGDLIRARYGHSVEVKLDFPEADVTTLYHGTSPSAAKRIVVEGLSPMGRRMVHLSVTVKDAIEVGRRHSMNPVVLAVDVKLAKSRGSRIVKASERVYLADYVPANSIRLLRGLG